MKKHEQLENQKLFRKYNPESRGPETTKYLQINENYLNSLNDFHQVYLPKLRLAKVFGFEGLKKIQTQINKNRSIFGLPNIELNEYFPDEVQRRNKNQE